MLLLTHLGSDARPFNQIARLHVAVTRKIRPRRDQRSISETVP